MIKNIDARRQAIIFDANLLIPYLVDQFYLELDKALKNKGRFNVALSGGSTPKKLYEAICRDPRALQTAWDKVHVYFGDERAVDFDHPDSNYKMSMDAGFKSLKGVHMYPMHAHLKTEKAAADYNSQLPSHMDLTYLGMGDDGHTASLFPADPLLKITDKNAVIGFVTSKSAVRMTFTLPYINKSEKIVFMIVGASKKQKVKEVLSSQGDYYPSFHIGTKEHPALFVMDKDAASLL